MDTNELLEIVEKYKKLSREIEQHDEEKAHEYEQFSGWIEDKIDTFEEDDTEEDLLFLFKEQMEESENWSYLFPDGGEEDIN